MVACSQPVDGLTLGLIAAIVFLLICFLVWLGHGLMEINRQREGAKHMKHEDDEPERDPWHRFIDTVEHELDKPF